MFQISIKTAFDVMILGENNGAKWRISKLASKSKDKVNKMIFFELYHSENNLHFDETLVMFVLFQTNMYTFKWIVYSVNFVSSVCGYTWHSSYTIMFQSKPDISLIYCEPENTNCIVFDLTVIRWLNPRSTRREAITLIIVPLMRSGIYLTDCKRYLIDVMIRENTTCRTCFM